MEYRVTTPFDSELTPEESESLDRRLATLILANADTDRRNKLYPTLATEAEVAAMQRPLKPETAFAYYGLMIGSLVPASIFTAFSLSSAGRMASMLYLMMLMTTIVSAAAGYSFGKVIAKFVENVEPKPLHLRLPLLAIIGSLWGIVAGGSGGIFIFVFGAFFGAVLGGAVGMIALPAFALPYCAIRRARLIDLRHFLPLALGFTLVICSFVFGTVYR
ncbi:MAG: hypothetical protein K1X36_12605 [Pyrinomonadaceae bacterium]|nr:hypothetical protein [Pyrinomonadaceae bacterium]